MRKHIRYDKNFPIMSIEDTMILRSFSVEELERRKAAFMGMWQEMLPIVEQEVQMSYDEILQLV